MNKASIVALTLASVAGVTTGGVFWFEHAFHKALDARNGPPHVFRLSERPTFLREDIAGTNALAALVLDGYGEGCRPVPDGRTVAPDGSRDKYLARNTITPNDGWIAFTNGAGQYFHVDLHLDGQELTCRRMVGK
jgi:hypothetical protein